MQKSNIASDKSVLKIGLLSLFSAANAFRTFGAIGFALGLPYALMLASHRGLSPRLMAGIAVSALATLILTGYASIVLTGRESLIFYRSIVFIFAVSALIPKLLHQSVLDYLDVTALASAVFLACGRLGCLSVGCCHGRPSRWGVRYGGAHVRTGFAPWLEGVRLFPIQAVESLYVFTIAIVGGVWFWRHPVAGAVLGFSILAYAFGRFYLEFFRGDDARPYFLTFSEAQWISIVLVGAYFLAEKLRLLPASPFLLKISLILGVSIVAVMLFRLLGRFPSYRLFSAPHLNEIARSIRILQARPVSSDIPPSAENLAEIPLLETSQNVRISLGLVHCFRRSVAHFSVSWPEHVLTSRDAARLARLFERLLRTTRSCQVVRTPRGVFHFLFS